MKKLLAFWLICCLAVSLGSGCMAETAPGPGGLPEVRDGLGAAGLIGTFAAGYFQLSAPEKLDGDPPITADEPAGTWEEVPVWKFCHGVREGLETAEIEGALYDCEEGPIPTEITDEEKEQIRDLAINGVITGEVDEGVPTGNTWVYSFISPDGEYLLGIEMYKGRIITGGRMYTFRRPLN